MTGETALYVADSGSMKTTILAWGVVHKLARTQPQSEYLTNVGTDRFPLTVGYKAMTTVEDNDFRMEILDHGKQPEFEVRHPKTKIKVRELTMRGAWQKIFDQMVAKGYMKTDPSRSISGPQFFGFQDVNVRNQLKSMLSYAAAGDADNAKAMTTSIAPWHNSGRQGGKGDGSSQAEQQTQAAARAAAMAAQAQHYSNAMQYPGMMWRPGGIEQPTMMINYVTGLLSTCQAINEAIRDLPANEALNNAKQKITGIHAYLANDYNQLAATIRHHQQIVMDQHQYAMAANAGHANAPAAAPSGKKARGKKGKDEGGPYREIQQVHVQDSDVSAANLLTTLLKKKVSPVYRTTAADLEAIKDEPKLTVAVIEWQLRLHNVHATGPRQTKLDALYRHVTSQSPSTTKAKKGKRGASKNTDTEATEPRSSRGRTAAKDTSGKGKGKRAAPVKESPPAKKARTSRMAKIVNSAKEKEAPRASTRSSRRRR